MRIAIADDTPMAVEVLRRILAQVPEYRLAWVADDGAQAVEKCAADRPDLVLMDLVMPVMDGVEATRRIMERTPCAVLIVTSSIESQAGKVFEAMGHGALDAVDTPDGLEGRALLGKIATIAKLVGKSGSARNGLPRSLPPAPATPAPPLAVMGSSTGGPHALARILAALPADFPAAAVIVQHVDAQFAGGLVSWLDAQTPLAVRLAQAGCRPAVGTVWVAGSNDHLVLRADLSLNYVAEPRAAAYRPSVDAFFRSVAEHWPGKGVGVLLTGMGYDGAEGLLALRRADWETIAQDEETCVVYGMPKVAAQLGAAQEILPIGRIGPTLVAFFNQHGARGFAGPRLQHRR